MLKQLRHYTTFTKTIWAQQIWEGNVVYKQNYYPYGNTRSQQPASGNQSQVTEHQYTSQVSDQKQTNLYYYNARYYSPQTAKFTSADTQDGPNRYLYVSNNPVKYIDPSGHIMIAGGGSGSESNSADGINIQILATETMGQTMCYGYGAGCGNDFPSSYYMDQEEAVAWWGLGAVYWSSVGLTAAAPAVYTELGLWAATSPAAAKIFTGLSIAGTASDVYDVSTCVFGGDYSGVISAMADPTPGNFLDDLVTVSLRQISSSIERQTAQILDEINTWMALEEAAMRLNKLFSEMPIPPNSAVAMTDLGNKRLFTRNLGFSSYTISLGAYMEDFGIGNGLTVYSIGMH